MIWPIVLIVIMVIIKAIFSASDTAFTYINRAEIRQLSKKDKKADKIRILMDDSNKFFGTIEVGINICELLASAIVSITILEYLMATFRINGLSETLAIVLAVALVTIILSYIMLIFGAILPKKIARNKPKKVAYKLVSIVWIVSKLNYPFERIIDFSTNLFAKIFRIKQEPEERMTEKQLKMIIKEAKDEGVLESIEKKIFLNIIKANNMQVNKIMIPIDKTFCINLEDSFTKVLKEIKENRYTRIPVYKDDIENIIGILNVKDIAIKYTKEGIKDKKQIEKILRELLYIKEDERLLDTFKKLQKNNQVIAIISNEENMPVGLLSIEDILEKMVGEIFDEDDLKKT